MGDNPSDLVENQWVKGWEGGNYEASLARTMVTTHEMSPQSYEVDEVKEWRGWLDDNVQHVSLSTRTPLLPRQTCKGRSQVLHLEVRRRQRLRIDDLQHGWCLRTMQLSIICSKRRNATPHETLCSTIPHCTRSRRIVHTNGASKVLPWDCHIASTHSMPS
jgi:hypothetical protein